MMLKTAPRAKATAHRVATAQLVVSAASVLNVQSSQRVTYVRMTVQRAAQKHDQKAAIHATSVGMTVARVVTAMAKPH